MSIELQQIDCNCNDCKFMIRDTVKRKESIDFQHQMQLNYFNLIKAKTEDEKMKFQFDSSKAAIHYGNCSKLNKAVSFIPNICQLDTQECFEHRKQ